jgi:hypothetical protein
MMGSTTLIVALTVGIVGASIPEKAVERHNEAFQQYWNTDFVWKFDDLPTKGTVPKFRVPYSGYIYPDTAGGTSSVLSKYDRAFNNGRGMATSWERRDTTAFRKPTRTGGFFGLFGMTTMQTPSWHGHCNGWASAAIRHAEPQNSVRRNGVVFTPADIKGLLAEIYLYNDTLNLAGIDFPMNAGTLHVVMANWIGRGSHPIGMEADPGEEKWNYPVYAYAYSHAKRPHNRVEVKMNMAYAKDSRGEAHQSPRNRRIKYFHYSLDLNDEGEIIGGSFYRDSSRIDMLWAPLQPRQGGTEGNKRGNPYVKVDEILAIWRASVPEEMRHKWPVIDPPEADRIPDLLAAEEQAEEAESGEAEETTPADDTEEGDSDEVASAESVES